MRWLWPPWPEPLDLSQADVDHLLVGQFAQRLRDHLLQLQWIANNSGIYHHRGFCHFGS